MEMGNSIIIPLLQNSLEKFYMLNSYVDWRKRDVRICLVGMTFTIVAVEAYKKSICAHEIFNRSLMMAFCFVCFIEQQQQRRQMGLHQSDPLMNRKGSLLLFYSFHLFFFSVLIFYHSFFIFFSFTCF
jgi:hypothetical protein